MSETNYTSFLLISIISWFHLVNITLFITLHLHCMRINTSMNCFQREEKTGKHLLLGSSFQVHRKDTEPDQCWVGTFLEDTMSLNCFL